MASTKSTYGTPSDGPTITVVVKNPAKQPWIGLRVTMIVNGRGLPGLTTDGEGCATWHIGSAGVYGVPKAKTYDYNLAVFQGDRAAGRASGKASPQQQALVVVTPAPCRASTAYEQLLDIALTAAKLRSQFKTIRGNLKSTPWSHQVGALDKIGGGLDAFGRTSMTMVGLMHDVRDVVPDSAWGDVLSIYAPEVARADAAGVGPEFRAFLANESSNATRAVATQGTKAFRALDGAGRSLLLSPKAIIPNVFEIHSMMLEMAVSLADGDVRGAALGLARFAAESVIGATPAGAFILLGVHAYMGLKAALTPGPNTKAASVRQCHLEKFNKVGSCPVYAGGWHSRIDLTTTPWSVKKYATCVRGLAFDPRGRLVLVDETGAILPLPTDTTAEAKRIAEVVDFVTQFGWTPSHTKAGARMKRCA